VALENRKDFEDAAIELAEWVSPTKLDRTLTLMRDRLQPESATVRHTTAMERRRVETSAERDGMGWWTAYLPVHAIAAGEARINAFALSAKADGDERTMPQIRADVFADLIAGDEDTTSSVRPTVFVTMTAETAIGSDEPAELNGFGQITAHVAREHLGRAAAFYRVLVEPGTGNILEVSSQSRYVPAAMKRWLRLRDVTCRFPACCAHADRAELDHTTDFALGGPTSVQNLAHLCKKHHRLKHLAPWPGVQDSNGVITWTSPNGRVDVTRPEIVMPKFTVGPAIPVAKKRAVAQIRTLEEDPPPF